MNDLFQLMMEFFQNSEIPVFVRFVLPFLFFYASMIAFFMAALQSAGVKLTVGCDSCPTVWFVLSVLWIFLIPVFFGLLLGRFFKLCTESFKEVKSMIHRNKYKFDKIEWDMKKDDNNFVIIRRGTFAEEI